MLPESHCSFIGQRRTGPRLSLVSPKVFLSNLSLMDFWLLATVALAFGLLSWGHLIFDNIIDLCCIIFKAASILYNLHCKKRYINKVDLTL